MSFHWKLCLKKTFRQTYVFVYHVVHCLRLLYHFGLYRFGRCLFVELILSANFSYSISTSSFCPSSSCNISLSRWHGSFVWAPRHTYPSIRGTCCETHADMWVVCFDIWHMVLRSHLSNIHHLGAHSGTYIHACAHDTMFCEDGDAWIVEHRWLHHNPLLLSMSMRLCRNLWCTWWVLLA